MKILVPHAALIGLTILLVQWHSIEYWHTTVGEMGVLWSICLEACCLWLWWHQRRVMAALCTAVLASGPMLTLINPIVSEARIERAKLHAYTAQLALGEDTIQQLTNSLESYESTSQSRTGWASRIDDAQTALNEARQSQSKLIANAPSRPLNGWRHIEVAVKISAIILTMLTQIMAIRLLHRQLEARQRDSTHADSPKSGNTRLSQEEVSRLLAKEIQLSGKPQVEWASVHGLSAKAVSMIINHHTRASQGKECASKKQFQMVEKILLNPTIKAPSG